MRLAKSGFSFLETLVTVSIMSVAGLALTNLNVAGMKANKSSLIRLELMDTKRTITNLLSCERTLGARPVTCSGDQVLRNNAGDPILTNGKLGAWTIRATCEVLNSVNGLSIRASKSIEGSSPAAYVIDPLSQLPLNEFHPASMLYAPAVRPCADSFSNVAAEPPLIPYGGIMLWAGRLDSIPVGWALCDGNNGTPDLRNRFIVGAGSSYSPGQTGGSADEVLVAHSHGPGIPPSFNGGFSTSNPNGPDTGNYALTPVGVTLRLDPRRGQGYVSQRTTIEGWSDGIGMNIPPYFALAYIMRIQ